MWEALLGLAHYMNIHPSKSYSEEYENAPLSLKNVAIALGSRWYWITLSFIIFLLLGWGSLKIIKPRYKAEAILHYSEDRSIADQLAPPEASFFLATSNAPLLAEKYKLVATQLVREAVLATYSFFRFSRIKDLRTIDTYPFTPLQIKVLRFEPSLFEEGTFHLHSDLSLSYQVTGKEEMSLSYHEGAAVEVPGLTFEVLAVTTEKGYTYQFEYAGSHRVVKEITERISLKETKEHIAVMKLAFVHANARFATDFLQQLLAVYERHDLKEKQFITDRTLHFIQKELGNLNDSIRASSHALVQFRKQNEMGDLTNENRDLEEEVQRLEHELHKLLTQQSFIEQVGKALDAATFEQLDFLSVGWDDRVDKVLISLLNQYNEAIAQRFHLLETHVETSPTIQRATAQLHQLKRQLVENIHFQRMTNERLIISTDVALQKARSKRSHLPLYEQQYSNLANDHRIHEATHAQLLTKHLETAIVQSGIIPSFKVIDIAKVEHTFPKKLPTLAFFSLLGVLCGSILVLLWRRSTTKFHKIASNDPWLLHRLIGVIPHRTKSYTFLATLSHERSAFTESFSNLRMQLSWSLPTDTTQAKVVVITSATANEGKSFVAAHLCASYANVGKKILLIDADLQRPSLHHYFTNQGVVGLADFLLSDRIQINELPHATILPSLFYIHAGSNEGNIHLDQLAFAKMDQLLQWARTHYELIIIDTPPVGLITDAFDIIKKADCTLFVIRWLYSEQSVEDFAQSMETKMQLDNLRIVLNDYYDDALYRPLSSSAPPIWTPGYYSKNATGDGYYYTR